MPKKRHVIWQKDILPSTVKPPNHHCHYYSLSLHLLRHKEILQLHHLHFHPSVDHVVWADFCCLQPCQSAQ